MAFIILGLVSLALSRLIDLWGMAEGFGLTVVVTVLGNVPDETIASLIADASS